MNIGNITSNNFNLDGNGKDMQIEVYEQLIEQLQQENQELKNQIETLEKANKQLISKVDRYDAIVDERDELKKQLKEYIKQNMKLKDELFDKRKEYQDTYKDVRIEIKEYKTQQKEFIDYLENEINKIKEQIRTYDIWHEVGVDINFLILKKQFFIEILSKYKEIIGVSNEKSKDK